MFRRFLARVFGTTFAQHLERPLRPPGLGLEALEAREVPAAFVVNSTGDVGDSDLADGIAWTGRLIMHARLGQVQEVTLRAAIEQAGAIPVPAGQPEHEISCSGLFGPNQQNPASIILTRPLDGISDIRQPMVIDGVDRNLLTITRDTTQPGFQYFGVARTADVSKDIQVQFKNMTIRDANATVAGFDKGGAIANFANLTLTNVDLLENAATDGGGIFNDTTGVLTLQNCLLLGNEATRDGGGICATGSSQTTITDSELTDNTASNGKGGAIAFNVQSLVSLSNTDLMQNSAAYGGAVYASVGNAAVIAFQMTGGDVFSNSSTSQGGALYLSSANARIEDVYFDDNSSETGGAIFSKLNSLELIGCEFAENVASNQGPIVAYVGILDYTVWITPTGCTGIGNADLIRYTGP